MKNRQINCCKIAIGVLLITAILFIVIAINIANNVLTVTFNSNEGTTVENQVVWKGNTVIRPQDPIGPEGTEFAGWYYNNQLWDFENNVVTQNITLQARWNWNGEGADYSWFTDKSYETTEKFTISNGSQLYALANLVRGEANINNMTPVDFSGKEIILTDDIYIATHDWTPIGTAVIPFKGDFNGNNHTISGLTITDENTRITEWDAALFGYISGTADDYVEIKDLNVTDVNINLNVKNGNRYSAAAISGYIGYANISNVKASGSINVNTNASTVAGMFIVNENAIKMENVINNVEISGTRYNADGTGTAYFILGGIVGQTTGVGPFYYKNCANNANLKMNNPFEDDLTSYVGKYTPETIAGHIVGQGSGGEKSRLVFDNCFVGENGIIKGAHSYLIQPNGSTEYSLVFAIQSVFQGDRYISQTETTKYGYTYQPGDIDKSFRYGNETLYFVPTDTEFNLETINTDYLVKNDTGFVQKENCFYLPNIATVEEDIKAIAEGKALISYSSGMHGIIYTYNK